MRLPQFMIRKFEQVVNNSTNINKMNNHLSLKTKRGTMTNVGNLGLGLGQAHKYGGVKPVNVIPILSSPIFDLFDINRPTDIFIRSLLDFDMYINKTQVSYLLNE